MVHTGVVLLILFLGLPVGWLVSELKGYDRRSRITRGILAIVSTLLISIAFGLIERLNYSTNYAMTSRHLVDVTITQLEKGNNETVLSSFKKLRNQFHFDAGDSLEKYNKLVKEAIFYMENKNWNGR
jgi:hypothetical protein